MEKRIALLGRESTILHLALDSAGLLKSLQISALSRKASA
jgi:hypothetical protein